MGSRILVTGGAGFVGSTLALLFKSARLDEGIVAIDNSKRRGSGLAISRLKAGGADFVHGDARNPDDRETLRDVELLLECLAKPSVQADYDGDSRYLENTNLQGTLNLGSVPETHLAGTSALSSRRLVNNQIPGVIPMTPGRIERLTLERRRKENR